MREAFFDLPKLNDLWKSHGINCKAIFCLFGVRLPSRKHPNENYFIGYNVSEYTIRWIIIIYLRLWDTKLLEVKKSWSQRPPTPGSPFPTAPERFDLAHLRHFCSPLLSSSPIAPFKRVQSSVCPSQWVECVESACGRGTDWPPALGWGGGMLGHVAPASQVTWAWEQLAEMGKGRFGSPSVFRIPPPPQFLHRHRLTYWRPSQNIHDFHRYKNKIVIDHEIHFRLRCMFVGRPNCGLIIWSSINVT